MAVEFERGLVKTSFGYIHYRAAGTGKPIVLLHPNQQSSELYREMMEALAPHFRAIAIDNPSYGDSDHIQGQPRIEDYARNVIEVMDALNIDTFIAAGEAVGAAVAAELGGTYPARVTHVVLMNCPAIQEETTDEILADFKNTFRPSDPTGFPALRTIEFMLEKDPEHSPVAPTQDWMDRINTAQIECGRERWQMLEALTLYKIADGLKRVAQPVLLVTGENFYWVHRLHLVQACIRNLTSHMLKGARICIGWERAEEISKKIVEFVR